MVQILPDKVVFPKVRYERIGECNRCGWCCQFEDCEHFVPAEVTEDSKAICNIHDQERPAKCVDFPQLPPILHEECGYRFIDKYDNDRELCHREV